MGQSLSNVFGRAQSPELKLLILGIDGAGKTTIFQRLTTGTTKETVPTQVFNIDWINYRNKRFLLQDLGGSNCLPNWRLLWLHFFNETKCFVYVVDSSDRERIAEAKHELHNLNIDNYLEEQEYVMLVLANKSDRPNALSVAEITRELDMDTALPVHRRWHVMGCSAQTGDGLTEALDWLSDVL